MKGSISERSNSLIGNRNTSGWQRGEHEEKVKKGRKQQQEELKIQIHEGKLYDYKSSQKYLYISGGFY